MSQQQNVTSPSELNGIVNIPGANAGNTQPGMTSEHLNDEDGCTAMAHHQQTDQTGTNVGTLETSSDVAGDEENDTVTDQVGATEALRQQDRDSRLQASDNYVEDHGILEVANNTETTGTVFEPCLSCGFVPNEDRPMLEEHARHDVSCPTIQNEIEAQFIDIQSRKQEMFGENVEWLRLKEWLLCKACNRSHSTVVIGPCQHFCLCQVCSEMESCCPTCSGAIIHRVHAQTEYETTNAAQ